MNISIYDKKGKEIVSAVVGSNSYVFTQIMGDNYLQLEFKHSEFVKIDRYAYVVYNSVKYTLIEAVVVEQVSTVEWNFSARFEAPQKLLDNIMMSHMAGENQVSTKEYERDFSLAGTALEHLQMLWRNTDRLKATFVEPTEDSVASSLTGVKVVAYNNVSCLSALQLIANQFECEWYVTGNEGDGYSLHLGKCSFDENNPTKIAYGFGNGILPNTKKQLHKDAVKMTHICVQGGTQNINTLSQLTDKDGNVMNAYSFKTLHLPLLLNAVDGVGKIYYDVKNNKFDGETGFNSAYSVLLTIDRKANTMTSSLWNAEEDDIIEKAYDLSEFYPKKVRNISSWGFNANNTEFWVKDESIEEACNYNTYQLGGEKITIEFQTGALAGKSFDVIKYNHDEKKFECSLADYDTISMPASKAENAMWRPVDGDEFIVFGCSLPTTYFRDTTTDPYSGAEWDMCRRTASILCDNFEDKFAFSFTIDSNWLSRRTAEQRAKLRTGYWVHYVDSNLCGGGADIRITDVKQYLLKPYQPELTIGDEVKTVSTAQKLTQISSSVSATYNYVQNVQQETQQAIQQVEEKAFTQVQADWEEEDETKASFIQNKPEVIDGKDGKDAGFGSVTASVDKNVGTPSVVVTTSGTNQAKNFTFTFKNLRGEKGADGKDGAGVSILGSYETESALKTAHPTGSLGDAYIVGLDLYVWNGTEWKNVGQIKGQDGNDGEDGVSCTHVWNGTTLTITSASGTSSADLKGAKGDKGDDAIPLIDTSFPDSASDERVPSTKLVKTQLAGKSSTGHKHSASDITTGTLAVTRGGTGKTTLTEACNAFINALTTGTSIPTDSDYIISQYVGGGTSTISYHRRPISKIWDYIKGKADTVYSLATHKHSATDITSGVLTSERGGTGKSTLKEAMSAMVNALDAESGNPTDEEYMVCQISTDSTNYIRKKMKYVYSYIKGKTDSLYSAIGHTHVKSDITDLSLPTIVTSVPLQANDNDVYSAKLSQTEHAKCIKNNESGTIESSTITPLTLKRSTANKVRMLFANLSGNLGAIVAGIDKKPYWYDTIDEKRIVLENDLKKLSAITYRWTKSGTGSNETTSYTSTNTTNQGVISQTNAGMPTGFCFQVDGLESHDDYVSFLIRNKISVQEKQILADGTTAVHVYDLFSVNINSSNVTYLEVVLPTTGRLEPTSRQDPVYISFVCNEM